MITTLNSELREIRRSHITQSIRWSQGRKKVQKRPLSSSSLSSLVPPGPLSLKEGLAKYGVRDADRENPTVAPDGHVYSMGVRWSKPHTSCGPCSRENHDCWLREVPLEGKPSVCLRCTAGRQKCGRPASFRKKCQSSAGGLAVSSPEKQGQSEKKPQKHRAVFRTEEEEVEKETKTTPNPKTKPETKKVLAREKEPKDLETDSEVEIIETTFKGKRMQTPVVKPVQTQKETETETIKKAKRMDKGKGKRLAEDSESDQEFPHNLSAADLRSKRSVPTLLGTAAAAPTRAPSPSKLKKPKLDPRPNLAAAAEGPAVSSYSTSDQRLTDIQAILTEAMADQKAFFSKMLTVLTSDHRDQTDRYYDIAEKQSALLEKGFKLQEDSSGQHHTLREILAQNHDLYEALATSHSDQQSTKAAKERQAVAIEEQMARIIDLQESTKAVLENNTAMCERHLATITESASRISQSIDRMSQDFRIQVESLFLGAGPNVTAAATQRESDMFPAVRFQAEQVTRATEVNPQAAPPRFRHKTQIFIHNLDSEVQ